MAAGRRCGRRCGRTDYVQAVADADAAGKAVLLDFTGSDWCGWCRRLDEEGFGRKAFKDFAAERLVLMEVDFPRRKTLAEAVAAQNRELAERFGVSGYPTIVLLDEGGKEIGRLGYMQGGAKTFVRELKRLIAAAKAGGG